MTIKVLTVDDEPDVRRLIEVKLKKAGFEVITAVDGEEGVEKAKSENPDLILMDVMMPKMDGYTAVEKIKTEMDPAPLVMMLTAKGTEDDVMQGLMGGADDYITKPFAPRELIARVKVTLIKAGRKADLPPE
ncbi:MAG: response regulator [Chloroflexi bacterium]|jgi:two-component system alkaline phosphatase synthesis response regulator PhoP|nr:response regulator [Chloroflexota bacterium]